VTLDARTRPLREEIEANIAEIFELVRWLEENPHAREDLRREKFAAWRNLERENAQIERMWDESRERWLKQRMNRPASVAELVSEVVGAVDGEP
jgi:hypothetical protein